VAQLSAQGISKTDPEFKELFGFVYRGSAFAMVSLSLLFSFFFLLTRSLLLVEEYDKG
jgi:hypothetical protein